MRYGRRVPEYLRYPSPSMYSVHMIEQMRLDGIEVPHEPFRLSPATCLLGRRMVAECRAILAAAKDGLALSETVM